MVTHGIWSISVDEMQTTFNYSLLRPDAPNWIRIVYLRYLLRNVCHEGLPVIQARWNCALLSSSLVVFGWEQWNQAQQKFCWEVIGTFFFRISSPHVSMFLDYDLITDDYHNCFDSVLYNCVINFTVNQSFLGKVCICIMKSRIHVRLSNCFLMAYFWCTNHTVTLFQLV